MYSINVLLVSYNQEKEIRRAIDSVLCQKQYGLNKIIICDDGSTDETLSIIRDYELLYPDVIRVYTNQKNLGRAKMYNNIWKAVTNRGEADLFCMLSGDDAFCDGWFKTIQCFVSSKEINVKECAVTIFSNWKSINPNGDEKVNKGNHHVDNDKLDLTSLKLRALIFNRSLMISQKVYEKFSPLILDEGLCLAEEMYDIQIEKCTDYGYYCDYVGSIYYTGIGVSKELLGSVDYYTERVRACERMKSLFNYRKKDVLYWDYLGSIYSILYNPTISNLLRIIRNYAKSFDFKYNRLSFSHDVLMFLACVKRTIKKLFCHSSKP